MNFFSKKYILFFFFIAFAFLLFFPEPSWAAPVYCYTECGEEEVCGETSNEYCDECCVGCWVTECVPDPCCTTDEGENCLPDDCCTTEEVWDDCCWTKPCCPCCTKYHCSRSYTVYRATEGCEPVIEKGRCWGVCSIMDGDECCDCGGCELECGEWEPCEECESWQIAERDCPATLIGLDKPECVCEGNCIAEPINPRYYISMIFPLDESHIIEGLAPIPGGIFESAAYKIYEADSNNIQLPVKLDWDDVRGWNQQWKENETVRQVLDCQAGTRACYEAPSDPAFDAKSEELRLCKKDCRTSCLAEVAGTTITNGYWLAPYKIPELYKDCIRDCEDDCQNQYKTTAAGCTEICPAPTGDKCYLQPEGYAQSYEIKIEGALPETLRSPESLEELDRLEELIKEEKKKASPDKQAIFDWQNEIKRIRKEELEIDEYTDFLDKSEFIPPASCLLKSNRTYQWQVRACCPLKEQLAAMDEAARNQACGPWSEEWQFTTNPAPEPKLPYDPDWYGWAKAENVPKKAIEKLKWCEINDPELYARFIVEGEEWYSPRSYDLWLHYRDPEYVSSPGLLFFGRCHPNLVEAEKCQRLLLAPDPQSGDPFANLMHPFEFWDRDNVFFTKGTIYSWMVGANVGIGLDLTGVSQRWHFIAEDFTLTARLGVPPNQEEPPVGLPLLLKWGSPYAFSWNYILSGGEKTFAGKLRAHNITFDYPDLALDTVYTWQVQPCWDYEAEEEKCEDFWSGPWTFKTTGRPPELLEPAHGAEKAVIPATFKWEDVGGAKSYIFKINGKEKIVEGEAEITLDYPELRQETEYSWQVKTCARANGELCGKNWSDKWQFTTFKLKAPQNPKPADNDIIYTYQSPHAISWEAVDGAKAYKYKVVFAGAAPEDPKEECKALEGETIAEDITDQTLVGLPLKCWGEYQWQVTACLDENCQAPGQEGDIWSFGLVAKEAPPEKRGWGLVPCGRDTYDPTTPWDETESCEAKHIFIMLKIIIDFLLFRLAPIALVLLAAASGVIFYFSISLGSLPPAVAVKSLWKAAAIGFGILLFSWLIITYFFALIGYQFGPWWRF